MSVTGILAIAVFALLPHWYYGHLISAQQSRNQYIQNQINVANQKLQKISKLKSIRSRIINRMQVIEKLQNARPAIVHYFDQLVATIPNGVYLKSLQQSGSTTTLQGVANANANISAYMSNLAQSKWFAQPRLIVIHHHYSNGKQHSDFTLKVQSSHPASKSKDKSHNGKKGH